MKLSRTLVVALLIFILNTSLVTAVPNTVYVANAGAGANSISVIDTTSNTVTATITMSVSPRELAIAPDGRFLYVANNNGNPNVTVVDTSTFALITTIPVGTTPREIAITPDGQYAYVANNGSANVSVISTSTNTVVTTISVGAGPQGVATSPDGQRVYVTNATDNTLSVIATSNNAVIATVSLFGSNSTGVGVFNNNQTVYVGATGDGTTVNANTFATGHLLTGSNTRSFAFTPDGQYAYATLGGVNQVGIVSTTTNVLLSTIPVGTNPVELAITPSGQFVYVVAATSSVVNVINTSNNTVIATIPVGLTPIGIAISPATNLNTVQGIQQKNNFGTQIDLVNVITWASQPFPVISYNIYRNAALTDLAASVSGTTLSFADHDRKKGVSYRYYVASVSQSGSLFLMGTVSVP